MCGNATIGDINGIQSTEVRDLTAYALRCFELREGCGAKRTHDGAGVLCNIPSGFKRRVADEAGIKVPADPNDIGIGTIFLPRAEAGAQTMRDLVARSVVHFFGKETQFAWRKIPVEDGTGGRASPLSRREQEALPRMEQLILVRPSDYSEPGYVWNDHLFFLAKRILRRYRERLASGESGFDERVFPTLISSTKILYKGMVAGAGLFDLFPDLRADDFTMSVALLHNRFSTNTLPDPIRAQPGEMIAHNGEFALRGNQAWMRAAEERLRISQPDLYKRVHPLMNSELTDSGQADDLLRLLCRVAHLPVDHAVMMIMQQFQDSMRNLSPEDHAFLEYQAARISPWAGPALITFYDTDRDGTEIFGARNDLNGKRPAWWTRYKNGIFYVGSETGALPYPDTEIVEDGQLDSGEMVSCRAGTGVVETNRQIIRRLASEATYTRFTSRIVTVPDVSFQRSDYVTTEPEEISLLFRFQAAGIGLEELQRFVVGMAKTGNQPGGSMGRDSASPGLSGKPSLLHDRFRQGFAEVTNPPLDAKLEGHRFTTMTSYLGERQPLLGAVDYLKEMGKLSHPVISVGELNFVKEKLGHLVKTIDTTYPVAMGEKGWKVTLERLCSRVDDAIEDGKRIIVVTDRAVQPSRLISSERAAVTMLLAISTLNEHLVNSGKRHLVSLIAQSDECLDPHHAAVLFGYGAAAVCPHGALQFIVSDCEQFPARYGSIKPEKAVANYLKAMNDAVLKVMCKMGIPAFSSYMCGKVFSVVGLDPEFVKTYFGEHADSFGGDGLSELAATAIAFHKKAVRTLERANGSGLQLLPADYGRQLYHPLGVERRHGPEQVQLLQLAARSQNLQAWRDYVKSVEGLQVSPRDFLEFRYDVNQPIPIEEVESVWGILEWLRTSPISFGSISQPAHETMAAVMNLLGASSGSGEGGERFQRYFETPNGWDIHSAMKQIASGMFGVDAHYLVNAAQLEIKVAQGAKPGEGGELPGGKVTWQVGKLRHVKPGVPLPSPAPIHCLYSIEDLYLLNLALKTVNPTAKRWVKLVAQPGVGTVALGVRKTTADVWIAGGDGGTGSAPQISINNAGDDWETGLVEAHTALVNGELRSHTRIGADGGIQIPRHAVIAWILGADYVGLGTTPLEVLGCMQMKQCQGGGCLAGIATQDRRLVDAFPGKPEQLAFFFLAFAQGVREILASLGKRSVEEIIGQWDTLLQRREVAPGAPGYRNKLDKLLKPTAKTQPALRGFREELDLRPRGAAFDEQLIGNEMVAAVIDGDQNAATIGPLTVCNTDIAVGGGLAGHIARTFKTTGKLPSGKHITVNLKGDAGHFLGFANTGDLRLHLTGSSNGMVSMVMSGGKVVIRKVADCARTFLAGESVAYGMTGGELFIGGAVGKLAGVRLSGGSVVVEGCLDNAINFMTGGLFISLTDLSMKGLRREDKGHNIAAGMTGGIAFVYSEDPAFATNKVNENWVHAVRVGSEEQSELHRSVEAKVQIIGVEDVRQILDQDRLRQMVERHYAETKSERAYELLENWSHHSKYFWQLIPRYALNPTPMPTEADEKSEHEEYWYLNGKTPEQVLADLNWMTAASGLPMSAEVEVHN